MFWLPLILGLVTSFIGSQKAKAAQAQIDAAEHAKVPIEASRISQELIERGLGSSSYYGPAVAEPERMYRVAKRVRTAQEMLARPTIDPFVVAIQYLAEQQGSRT